MRRLACQAGYAAAGEEDLVREHAPLVRRIALQICSRMPASVELDDLVQEGLLGLLDAARRWKPGPDGVPFVVYARHRIRGSIYDGLRRRDLLPRYQRERLKDAQEAETTLTATLGRAPSDEEVASALGTTAQALRLMHEQAAAAAWSDAEPTAADPQTDPSDDPSERVAMRQLAGRLAPALQTLSVKEQQVLSLHYGEHLSFREVAFVMTLTPGRISQLHSQALRRLRAAITGEAIA